jgi:hypothetical protein
MVLTLLNMPEQPINLFPAMLMFRALPFFCWLRVPFCVSGPVQDPHPPEGGIGTETETETEAEAAVVVVTGAGAETEITEIVVAAVEVVVGEVAGAEVRIRTEEVGVGARHGAEAEAETETETGTNGPGRRKGSHLLPAKQLLALSLTPRSQSKRKQLQIHRT